MLLHALQVTTSQHLYYIQQHIYTHAYTPTICGLRIFPVYKTLKYTIKDGDNGQTYQTNEIEFRCQMVN